MPFTVFQDGASPVLLSNQTVFDRLQPDEDIPDLLRRIIRRNECVPVIFRDGQRGRIGSLNPPLEYEAQKLLPAPDPSEPQGKLALVPKRYAVVASMEFSIPVVVQLHASDEGAAFERAQGILTGEVPLTSDVEVEACRESLVEVFTEIDHALSEGVAPRIPFGTYDVTLDTIEEIDE